MMIFLQISVIVPKIMIIFATKYSIKLKTTKDEKQKIIDDSSNVGADSRCCYGTERLQVILIR